MRKLLSFLGLVMTITLYGQSTNHGKIRITIASEKSAVLENATVELIKTKDSSLVKVAITHKNGIAEFEKIPFGSYLLKASMVNYAVQYSAPLELSAVQSDINSPTLSLQPQAAQLAGVTVTGKKPFIQKLSDRLIVNVENSIVNYRLHHI